MLLQHAYPQILFASASASGLQGGMMQVYPHLQICTILKSVSTLTPDSTAWPQGGFGMRGTGTPEGLKQGLAAPTYRPSILPSRKAGAVASPDGRLRPTQAAAVKEILHQLVTDQRTLEVGLGLCACAPLQP